MVAEVVNPGPPVLCHSGLLPCWFPGAVVGAPDRMGPPRLSVNTRPVPAAWTRGRTSSAVDAAMGTVRQKRGVSGVPT